MKDDQAKRKISKNSPLIFTDNHLHPRIKEV